MKPSDLTEDEFIAELLRLHPELRVEILPNGKRVIHGIRLKTPEERRAAKKNKEKRP
jgi:hypothetical protein